MPDTKEEDSAAVWRVCTIRGTAIVERKHRSSSTTTAPRRSKKEGADATPSPAVRSARLFRKSAVVAVSTKLLARAGPSRHRESLYKEILASAVENPSQPPRWRAPRPAAACLRAPDEPARRRAIPANRCKQPAQNL